jgi:hypothetical protein
LWSVLTCAGAYFVGNALAGYPLLSLIITCVLSTALITGAIWAENKWSSRHGGRPARDPG